MESVKSSSDKVTFLGVRRLSVDFRQLYAHVGNDVLLWSI